MKGETLRRSDQTADSFILPSVTISPLSEISDPYVVRGVASAYYHAWKPSGLCSSPYEAIRNVSRFNPDYTIVARAPDESVVGVLHTVPFYAQTIRHLCYQLSSYQMVESYATRRTQLEHPPTVLVCFSLAAPYGYRVASRANGRGSISMPEMLVTHVPNPRRLRIVAYSKVDSVKTSLLQAVLSGFRDETALGPSGMHEHFGAIIAGFINGSRPGDEEGGGGNVIDVYAANKQEARTFARIKQHRTGRLPVNTLTGVSGSSIVLFSDVERALGLLDRPGFSLCL